MKSDVFVSSMDSTDLNIDDIIQEEISKLADQDVLSDSEDVEDLADTQTDRDDTDDNNCDELQQVFDKYHDYLQRQSDEFDQDPLSQSIANCCDQTVSFPLSVVEEIGRKIDEEDSEGEDNYEEQLGGDKMVDEDVDCEVPSLPLESTRPESSRYSSLSVRKLESDNPEKRLIEVRMERDEEMSALRTQRWKTWSELYKTLSDKIESSRNSAMTDLDLGAQQVAKYQQDLQTRMTEWESAALKLQEKEDVSDKNELQRIEAALTEERVRNDELNDLVKKITATRLFNAAVTIQKNFRGYRVRLRIGDDIERQLERARRSHFNELVIKEEKRRSKAVAHEHQRRRKEGESRLTTARTSSRTDSRLSSASTHLSSVVDLVPLDELQEENNNALDNNDAQDSSKNNIPVRNPNFSIANLNESVSINENNAEVSDSQPSKVSDKMKSNTPRYRQSNKNKVNANSSSKNEEDIKGNVVNVTASDVTYVIKDSTKNDKNRENIKKRNDGKSSKCESDDAIVEEQKNVKSVVESNSLKPSDKSISNIDKEKDLVEKVENDILNEEKSNESDVKLAINTFTVDKQVLDRKQDKSTEDVGVISRKTDDASGLVDESLPSSSLTTVKQTNLTVGLDVTNSDLNENNSSSSLHDELENSQIDKKQNVANDDTSVLKVDKPSVSKSHNSELSKNTATVNDDKTVIVYKDALTTGTTSGENVSESLKNEKVRNIDVIEHDSRGVESKSEYNDLETVCNKNEQFANNTTNKTIFKKGTCQEIANENEITVRQMSLQSKMVDNKNMLSTNDKQVAELVEVQQQKSENEIKKPTTDNSQLPSPLVVEDNTKSCKVEPPVIDLIDPRIDLSATLNDRRSSWIKNRKELHILLTEAVQETKGSRRNRKVPVVNFANLTNNEIISAAYLKRKSDLCEVVSLNLHSRPSFALSSIYNCVNVRRLTITDCDIHVLHFVNVCPNLQFLDAQHCNLSFCDLSTLSQLCHVNLSHNRLSHVQGLFSCQTLCYLNLSHNNFTSCVFLPHLRHLSYLNLSNNQLIDTNGLEMLPCLTWLDVSGNNICEMTSLECLHCLCYLDLSSNGISFCPPLTNSVLLIHLNISHNSLTAFTDNINDWKPCLSYVNLSHNQLTKVDHSVSNRYPLLTDLCVNANAIIDLQDLNIDYLNSHCKLLKTLNFDANPLCAAFKHQVISNEIMKYVNKVENYCLHFVPSANKDMFNSCLLKNSMKFVEDFDSLSCCYTCDHSSSHIDLELLFEKYTKVHQLVMNYRKYHEMEQYPLLISAIDRDSSTELTSNHVEDVDEHVDDKLNQAATKIAANFRGYMFRKTLDDNFKELDVAACKIQALWRGHQVRHWIRSALKEAQVEYSTTENFDDNDLMNFDTDNFDMDEIDVDAMFDDMQAPPTPRPSSRSAAAVTVTSTTTTKQPLNLKTAWGNSTPRGHNVQTAEQQMPTTRTVSSAASSSRRADTIIDLDQESQMTSGRRGHKKKEKIRYDWGFHDEHTAELMLQRANKMKHNSYRKKRLSKLDPHQRYILFKKLEMSRPPGATQRETKPESASKRIEYFHGKAVEEQKKLEEVRQQTYNWVFTSPLEATTDLDSSGHRNTSAPSHHRPSSHESSSSNYRSGFLPQISNSNSLVANDRRSSTGGGSVTQHRGNSKKMPAFIYR